MGAEKRKRGAEKRTKGCGEEKTLYFGATVLHVLWGWGLQVGDWEMGGYSSE